MTRNLVWMMICFLFMNACTGDEEDSSLMDGDTSDGDSDTRLKMGTKNPFPTGIHWKMGMMM